MLLLPSKRHFPVFLDSSDEEDNYFACMYVSLCAVKYHLGMLVYYKYVLREVDNH